MTPDWWRRELRARLGDLATIETLRLIEVAQDLAAEHGVTAPAPSDDWLHAIGAPEPSATAPPAPRAAPDAIRGRRHEVRCRCGATGKVTTALSDPAPVGWQCDKCAAAAAAAGTADPSDWRTPTVLGDAEAIAAWPAMSKHLTLLRIEATATRRCAAALMHDAADNDLVDPAILATWLTHDTWMARGMAGDPPTYAEVPCRDGNDARRRCPASDGNGWQCQRRAECVLAAAGV